jgi:group I intron endonuclease
MTGIYKITNPNGKVYIGQSINIEKRFKQHKRAFNLNSGTKLYNSLQKYGYNNHNFEIIAECIVEDLNKKERFYQEQFDSVNNGLNLCYTTTEIERGIIAEEVKNKISKSKTGIPKSTEHIDKIKAASAGRIWSEETLLKRSKSMKGKNTVKIKCVNDGMVFTSVKEAANFYGLKHATYIGEVCSGNKKHIKKLVFERI